MHVKHRMSRVVGAGVLALGLLALGMPTIGLLGGCRDDEQDDAGLDYDSLVEVKPNAVPPRIVFPPECRQQDPSVNEFVSGVLDICQRGDYDKFCNLFGINEVPPSHDSFERIWGGVGEVAVRSIHTAGQDPPQYFVHAVVKLRQPDAQKRMERDVVVRVFKELGEWRISGASKEIVRKVLIADTQPASGPASGDSSGASFRPAAPSSGPAVYKGKSQGS